MTATTTIPATGRSWLFGDNVSTDLIFPGRYVHLLSNFPELVKHTLEDARDDYASGVQHGDFVVAGDNFGMGSSREQAPLIIRLSGARAVIAKSFARIFYRNCFNVGLPAIELDTSVIADGDELKLDLAAGSLENVTRNERHSFPPLPPVMRGILDDGGLVEHIKRHGRFSL